MNTLELRKIRKCYDHFVAVDDLSFQIPAGEVYGLLGPNGAGKTSTIRMMIGILMPDSGSMALFGEPFRREHLDRVGYLPEERGLYPKMRVVDMITFIGELRGLSSKEAKLRAHKWLQGARRYRARSGDHPAPRSKNSVTAAACLRRYRERVQGFE